MKEPLMLNAIIAGIFAILGIVGKGVFDVLRHKKKDNAEAGKTTADSALAYAQAVREDLDKLQTKHDLLHEKYIEAIKYIAKVEGELKAYEKITGLLESKFEIKVPPTIKN